MGWLAVVAGMAFGMALLMLAAFFATQNDLFDRIAEWAFVVFGAASVPVMLAVGGRLAGSGTIVAALTTIGIISVAAVGIGELVITLRLVDFRRLAAVVSAGFIGVLAWVGLASAAALADGGLPTALSALGVATALLGVAIVGWLVLQPGVMRGEAEPPRPAMVAFVVPVVGIVAWLIWLGTIL